MSVAALTWPEAVVLVAAIGGVTLVLTVLVWSIFHTGQTAIRSENRHRPLVDDGGSRPRAEAS